MGHKLQIKLWGETTLPRAFSSSVSLPLSHSAELNPPSPLRRLLWAACIHLETDFSIFVRVNEELGGRREGKEGYKCRRFSQFLIYFFFVLLIYAKFFLNGWWPLRLESFVFFLFRNSGTFVKHSLWPTVDDQHQIRFFC